jgi:hypothetical protein
MRAHPGEIASAIGFAVADELPKVIAVESAGSGAFV